jgi:hypothetical protein
MDTSHGIFYQKRKTKYKQKSRTGQGGENGEEIKIYVRYRSAMQSVKPILLEFRSVPVNLWSIPRKGPSPDVVDTDTAAVSLGSYIPQNACSCEAAPLDQATSHGAVKLSQTDDEISVLSPVAPQGRGSPPVADSPLALKVLPVPELPMLKAKIHTIRKSRRIRGEPPEIAEGLPWRMR